MSTLRWFSKDCWSLDKTAYSSLLFMFVSEKGWVAAIQCNKGRRSALNRKRIEGMESKQVESGMLREQTRVLNVKQTNERVS